MKIFDAHFHIIDYQYPLIPNEGFVPDEFTCDDYKKKAQNLGIVGGAIVSGSYQEFDQTYLKAAMKNLGASFVGVTQLPASATNQQILELHKEGVRALRFNIHRLGIKELSDIETLAHRVYDLVGWHIELYVDSKQLADLYSLISDLPAVAIDHLGLSRRGFPALLKLVEQGTYVKATGFGRVNFDISFALQELIQSNPDAILFGTDLPSTRSPRPFEEHDIDLVIQAAGSQEIIEKILYRNAISLYQPPVKSHQS